MENELEINDYHLDRISRNLIVACNLRCSTFKSWDRIYVYVCISDMIYRSQLDIT
jgi:hypothetical protein